MKKGASKRIILKYSCMASTHKVDLTDKKTDKTAFGDRTLWDGTEVASEVLERV